MRTHEVQLKHATARTESQNDRLEAENQVGVGLVANNPRLEGTTEFQNFVRNLTYSPKIFEYIYTYIDCI